MHKVLENKKKMINALNWNIHFVHLVRIGIDDLYEFNLVTNAESLIGSICLKRRKQMYLYLIFERLQKPCILQWELLN